MTIRIITGIFITNYTLSNLEIFRKIFSLTSTLWLSEVCLLASAVAPRTGKIIRRKFATKWYTKLSVSHGIMFAHIAKISQGTERILQNSKKHLSTNNW